MFTIKKFIGSRSSLEIKQEILNDFYQALHIELKVELTTENHDTLFNRSTFELELDNGIVKYIHCDIFALIQCFRLKEKEKIDSALLTTFNNQGSFKTNSIYVEHCGDNFHFFELIEKQANDATLSMMSLVKITSIRSCEESTLKQRAKEYLDSHASRFSYLKLNFDLVDWELVVENQINLFSN